MINESVAQIDNLTKGNVQSISRAETVTSDVDVMAKSIVDSVKKNKF